MTVHVKTTDREGLMARARYKTGPKKGQFKPSGKGKGKGGGRKAGSGRKRSRQSAVKRALAATGIFPVAPVRAVRVGTRLNGLSSVFLGKDIYNKFKGLPGANKAELRAGKRIDIVDRMSDSSVPLRERIAELPNIWLEHSRGILSRRGLNRTVVPIVTGEALHQAAKATNANTYVPAPMRQFVKVY